MPSTEKEVSDIPRCGEFYCDGRFDISSWVKVAWNWDFCFVFSIVSLKCKDGTPDLSLR